MSEINLANEFWLKFCDRNSTVNRNEPYQVWFFGDNPEMANRLANLVLSRKKTATASLLTVNELKPENAPIPNGYSVITDFDGVPQCVLQTTEISVVPFNQVDREFAFDEGEDDQTLESWRAAHQKYFSKESADLDVEFNESSLIVCERFELLFSRTKA